MEWKELEPEERKRAEVAWPSPDPDREDTEELREVRDRIAALDAALLDLIAQRCRLAGRAGDCKRDRGWPLADPGQEARVVRRAAERARSLDLEEEGVRLLFWNVIGLSRRVQAAPSSVAPERGAVAPGNGVVARGGRPVHPPPAGGTP